MPAPKKEKTPAEIATAEQGKRDKFVELSNKRVSNALNAIAKIGGLGAKTYISEQFQRDAIAFALESEVTKAMTRLNGAAPATSGFSVPTAAPETPAS